MKNKITLKLMLATLVFSLTVATAEAQNLRLDITFTDPVINFGPLSFGIPEPSPPVPPAPFVPIPYPNVEKPEVSAIFFVGGGTPAGGGATSYSLADVSSASVPFGDGVFTSLSAFDLEVQADGTFESLSWIFDPISTPSVADGSIVLNSSLHITGTDIASGQPFSYTYTNSEETITAVPEPSTLAICLGLGLVGVFRRRSIWEISDNGCDPHFRLPVGLFGADDLVHTQSPR